MAMENVITYSLTRARASLRSGICPELRSLSGAYGPTLAGWLEPDRYG